MPELTRRSALLGGLATALVGAGVASARADESAPPTSDVATAEAAAAPAAAAPIPAQVKAAVAKMDALIPDFRARTGVPGIAVAIVYRGATIYAKGFGVRQEGLPDLVDAQTVFQLASVSKPLSASAICAATRRTGVRWTDPVRKGRPGFTLVDPYVSATVTLADMFSHRSGLPDHVGDLLEDLGYDQDAVLDRLRYVPLAPFRTQWMYTNYGLTAAGEAAATSVRQTFEQFVQGYLFGPLGMTDTSSTFAALQSRTNRAALHQHVGTKWVPNLSFDVDGQAPAGGISSNITDLAAWVTMLLADGKLANGRTLIDDATLKEMWTPRLVRGQVAKIGDLYPAYGYGWNVDVSAGGRFQVGHSGAFGTGAATNVTLVPALDLGIIALTNGQPVGLPEAVALTFVDLVELGAPRTDWVAFLGKYFADLDAAADNKQYDTPPPVVVPSRPLGRYVGTYANKYWGPMTVFRVGASGLRFTIGPKAQAYDLNHYTGDVFWFQTRGESNTGQSGATFSGSGAAPDTVTVQAWNTLGLGVFTRTS